MGHWDTVWTDRAPEQVSWYRPRPGVSLDLVRRAAPSLETPIIDVGGGASTLVDALLEDGYTEVTVLDVAAASLACAQRRLGPLAARVQWVVDDVCSFAPTRRYGVWHDRAVFHFLTDEEDRAAYRSVLRGALIPGGHAVVGTFAPDGPESCSGLPVARYDPAALVEALGGGLELVTSRREEHRTPSGAVQPFTFVLVRLVPS